MNLYVDGQHVQTASAIFVPELNPQAWIGRGHVNAGASYWRGMIDDVRFYRGALGTQDVVSLYEAYADADSDGLSNLSEYQAGSDPRDGDTDGDGLSDGDEENVYGTNPLSTESDGDGINDDVEVLSLGLNPASPDTDHDGWRDGVDPDPKSRIWADWGNAREWPDGVTRVTNRYGPVWCKEARSSMAAQ